MQLGKQPAFGGPVGLEVLLLLAFLALSLVALLARLALRGGLACFLALRSLHGLDLLWRNWKGDRNLRNSWDGSNRHGSRSSGLGAAPGCREHCASWQMNPSVHMDPNAHFGGLEKALQKCGRIL